MGVAEIRREVADANRARGLEWDQHLRCIYTSKHWYQQVITVAPGRPSLNFRDCYVQHMFVPDGCFSISVWRVNTRRLSVRNRTSHSLAILSQMHRIEGFDPLRFWELTYQITPKGTLHDVRFQYKLGWMVSASVFVDGLIGYQYERRGNLIPAVARRRLA